MPKQTKGKAGKGKPGKGIRVGIHFRDAKWPQDKAALHEHFGKLAPELVKGLKERTGNENLAKFNMFKEQGP